MPILGSIGAVLTDDDGYPIDYAFRRGAISTLELQIIGAQIERPISAIRDQGSDPERIRVTINASERLLLAAALGPEFTLVAVHRAERDPHRITRIEAAFEGLITRLHGLL